MTVHSQSNHAKVYLYLTKPEWADAWLNGGDIPISLASSYRSDDRGGVHTLDENRIHQSPVDFAELRTLGLNLDDVKGVTFRNVVVDDYHIPDFSGADFYKDDGLILSFCNVADRTILTRLEKAVCVVISDIHGLKQLIDNQLGNVGEAGYCEYTSDHQRNHFLKSAEDQWQEEYRLFWPIKEPTTVTLPPGVARLVNLS